MSRTRQEWAALQIGLPCTVSQSFMFSFSTFNIPRFAKAGVGDKSHTEFPAANNFELLSRKRGKGGGVKAGRMDVR